MKIEGNINVLLIHVGIMFVSGVFGGIINFLLESEKGKNGTSPVKMNPARSILIGIAASLLVPVFLIIISSDLIDLTKLMLSKLLTFWGFCQIAAISSKRFINTISEKLLKETKAELDSVKKTVEKREREYVADLRALNLLDNYFIKSTDADEEAVSLTELRKYIIESSFNVKANIFRKARDFRRDNYKNDPKQAEKVIPVFEVLIESDTDGKYHRNHAQLAFILKDKPEKDYNRALKELNTAIKIRNARGVLDAFRSYEFNRAVCLIATDPNCDKEKSDPVTKKKILEDLKASMMSSFWKDVVRTEFEATDNAPEFFHKWFKLNKITKDMLGI